MTKHETSGAGDEPQRNAKGAYLCPTPLFRPSGNHPRCQRIGPS